MDVHSSPSMVLEPLPGGDDALLRTTSALRGNAVKARYAVYGTQRVRHCIPTRRVGTRELELGNERKRSFAGMTASRNAGALQAEFPRRSVGTIN